MASQSTRQREWTTDTEAFLASILDGVAQPVWVVDHEGAILFANPAAVAALGYDDAAELRGRPSHETIHYQHPDGSHYPVEECPMLIPRTTGETIHREDDWFVRRDGSMFPVAYWSAPIETPRGRGAVVAFTDVEERLAKEHAERERDIARARAAEARAAQRRIIEQGYAARRKVTRDLHDGAQQQFVNAVINLQLAQEKWSSDGARCRELVDSATEDTKAGLEDLRELAAGIHPAILTSHGLVAALEALAARTALPTDVESDIQVPLPVEVEASVYFLISEALTNVAKHSRASGARVSVRFEGSWLSVKVSDDGIGGAKLGDGGSGLRGLVDRVEALEGTLEVKSAPRHGTVVRAEIPIRPAQSLS
jgi:PAS domain S-box-containing protein